MNQAGNEDGRWAVAESVAIGGTLIAALAMAPYAAAWLNDGSLIDVSLFEAVTGTLKAVARGQWADPASVFPAAARRHMPGAAGWWASAGWSLATILAFTAAIWRRVDAVATSSRAGRRPYDVRGSRVRPWARPRDLRRSTVGSRRPGRFTLGRIDGHLIASDTATHVAVIAPTRAGKTTRCVIPWLLEHDGPAIVTSTKLDVVQATKEWRSRRGTTWIWDPFGERSARWTPLSGCDNWSNALAQAQWLADAAQEGESEIAAYWRGEAAKLLAPLLHAAALDGREMSDVIRWIDAQDVKEPGGVLADAGRIDAQRQIKAVLDLDPRNRGTTYMSAGSLLAAFRYPQVDTCSGEQLTTGRFYDGGANTLYIVAGARHQRMLAPLVVGMLSSLIHEAAERARESGPINPTVRLLLDEAANIAPLRDLPAHLSQAAAHGLRVATIWQSVAQLQDRYRTSADSALANSTAKLFMGPITDERTRKYVQGLLGDVPVEVESRTDHGPLAGRQGTRTRAATWRPAVNARELQQLPRDRAILIDGANKPAAVALQAWWRDPELRRRGTSA